MSIRMFAPKMFATTVRRAALLAACAATLSPAWADDKKALLDQKIEILRGLQSEYAAAKIPLPRSKKPLDFDSSGVYDKTKWDAAGKQFGAAAKVGDLIQVTGVEIEKDTVTVEFNHGMKNQSKWYDHIQVGMGNSTRSVGSPQQNGTAANGLVIAIKFKGGIGDVASAEIKKMLAPVLDFEKHSATENYFDTLPPEIQQAITEKRATEGMDREMILLALGRPLRKTRESKDGVDFEDWIYGEPPGKVTFVTFSGAKVVKVKESYAGLGGSIADSPKPPI